ncbi:17623_t:CDS:2 [Entrophospora sp. SA101]|nr:13166_t:CDS:2 [Entrophospora sp. SA101]CAJ0627192.1 13319_t:CDS:2 [Entrophospora sp. SA101]CAJ0753633.1 17623_t:CDS:2 [Entrophospora sp. SA101]CAJ0824535.1 10849_t:CDS:2 [Entrophospora sp. SA101]CAJ0897195.1 4906_t:CDS:2 [Entrophospora sp. SA101]
MLTLKKLLSNNSINVDKNITASNKKLQQPQEVLMKEKELEKEKSSNQVDEQEWVKFQKLISKETQLSHQIADADEEELQKDRDEMQERFYKG